MLLPAVTAAVFGCRSSIINCVIRERNLISAFPKRIPWETVAIFPYHHKTRIHSNLARALYLRIGAQVRSTRTDALLVRRDVPSLRRSVDPGDVVQGHYRPHHPTAMADVLLVCSREPAAQYNPVSHLPGLDTEELQAWSANRPNWAQHGDSAISIS